MGKIAFLFPGQGSQKVGMGKELAQSRPALFERYLSQCDKVAGEPVSRLCLEGPMDELSQTQIAQPALFAYSLALAECAGQLGLSPDFVAGHSLGEYTAAVAAGVLSFPDGLALVCQRGRLMKQQQDAQPGTMAAIIGLSKETLASFCRAISQRELVQITNWNAPEQLVVSGTEKGVQMLLQLFKGKKGVIALRLPVKGAFHSALMKPVQEAMDGYTRDLSWHDATLPLVVNVSGSVLTQGEEIRQKLVEQIVSPVQWVACVQSLVAAGCDTFLELGPGQVLTKLVRLIAPDATAVALETPERLEAYLKSPIAGRSA